MVRTVSLDFVLLSLIFRREGGPGRSPVRLCPGLRFPSDLCIFTHGGGGLSPSLGTEVMSFWVEGEERN